MNDEFRDAEELDNFVAQYRQNHTVPPPSPEADFAADLVDIADSIQPSAAFLTRMESHLPSQFSTPIHSNGYKQKDKHMLHNRVYPPLRRYPSIPWTLAATLAVVFLATTLLVGLSIWSSVSPSNLAALTATPTPAVEKVLPISVGGYVSDFSEATLQQMRDAGLTWIGADLTYTNQANANTPSLITTAQSLITSAHDKGFRIMLRVSGIPSDMTIKMEPDYNTEYAQFVSYLATLKADAIQIWNQQNLDLFWQSNQLDPVDPAAYIDLLHQSYVAIKAVNPDTMVIIGAPAPTSAQTAFPGKIMNDDLYYEGMAEAYKALGEPAADCIGVTYIEGAVAPDQTSGDERDNLPTRYFTTMLHRAYTPFQSTGLPLCITEFGYLAGNNLEAQLDGILKPFFTDGFQWVRNITAEQQAVWLADGIKMAAEMSSIQVKMVMIWRVNGMPLNPLMYAAAIIRPDGSCPACTTIASLKQ
ncbi:MAG: hypothetical protein ABI690_18220 [Chloroflexota bacterium]